MSRLVATAFVLALCVTSAPALVTISQQEEFGPPTEKSRASAIEVPDITNAKADAATAVLDRLYALSEAPQRRYWSTKRFDGFGHMRREDRIACQGDVAAANRAMADFATLAVTHKEIRLFPAPGVVRSFNGAKPVPCAWHIEWTSYVTFNRRDARGESKATPPTHSAVLTVFVARAGRIPEADPRIGAWINDLDDARFAVRQQAFRSLAEQQAAAEPALRQALAGDASLEKKKRLEQLLERLTPLHLARLELPKGTPILELDALLERAHKDWRSGDLGKSYSAAEHIAAWAEHTEAALPTLVEMLADSREQVRDFAVRALQRAGASAASVLPALRAAQVPQAHREHLRLALAAVEKAAPVAADFWSENRRLRGEIATQCRASK